MKFLCICLSPAMFEKELAKYGIEDRPRTADDFKRATAALKAFCDYPI